MTSLFSELLLGFRSPSRAQHRLLEWKYRRAGLSPHQIDLGDRSMHVWIGGEGPPLLLLHGFGATAIWQWHGQIRSFALRHRLIIPDLLFFGTSTTELAGRSLELQVESVERLLDHLEIERVHALGLSYGGFVAYLMASGLPHRVDKLLLVNSPGAIMTRADYDGLLDTFGVDSIEDVLLPTDSNGVKRLIHIALHRPPPVPRFALKDAHQTLFTQQVEEKRELLQDLLTALETPLGLDPIHHETLIVWGEHDRIFPLDVGRRLHDHLSHCARFSVVERTAHTPNLERGGRFNRLVLEFLADS